MFAAGSSMYGYMPLSSATNPPMNWGYTRTAEGFRHHITRGQYERINASTAPSKWLGQYGQFFEDLLDNFTLPLALLAVLPLCFCFQFPEREKNYIGFTVLCFFFMGFIMVFLMNPKMDVQARFVNRVFYSLAHGIFSLWIGLGTIFLVYLARQIRNRLPLELLLMGLVLLMGIGAILGKIAGD